MEMQEKSFDKFRQKGITWRLEQDLSGLIFMQKIIKEKKIWNLYKHC
jgi:hypothetical protein|nr:MAG TPA: hypothetical protein [Caudoviricetes sp.]